nr:hypothetical protein [Tanacetum cinerariifolium]
MVRDSVQLETAVNTISHEYILEFTSEYGIPEMLHPELPGPGDRIVDFPEGKGGCLFSKRPGKNTPQCYTKPLDSLKNWNNRFFWVDERVFPTVVDWRTNAPKDGMPAAGTYSVEAVRALDTHQRSPLDFSLEAWASDQGTAASKVPPSRDVPTAAAPEPSQLGLTSTASMPEDAPTGVSDPDPLCFADPPARPSADAAQSFPSIAAAGDPESKNASSPTKVESPGGVYRPEWGVTNGSLLDTAEACQDLVDHVAPPGNFFELRHMHNEDFLGQYNVNLARQVAMGSQLRLRFEQEAKLLKKSAAEDKSAGLIKELEDMRAQFSDLQVSHKHLSQQVASLKEQLSREEKLKAAFEEFKRYEDERVERRCVELDARLDALSIDFDEELYPHMLTAIAGRMWVVGHGLRLAMMKCAEFLEMRQAFADVVSAGVAKALQSLKDLKYPLLDQLEGLKDAPMDSDTGEDAPQYIRDLRPSSSQFTIPVHSEVRDPRNPWAYKEEMKLSDAIAANISRAEKKKKCRIVCRTHGVGSAHHARSDGVPVFVPTVVPQGLALLLVDAATQTDLEDT